MGQHIELQCISGDEINCKIFHISFSQQQMRLGGIIKTLSSKAGATNPEEKAGNLHAKCN
jgi:hypothetical protein